MPSLILSPLQCCALLSSFVALSQPVSARIRSHMSADDFMASLMGTSASNTPCTGASASNTPGQLALEIDLNGAVLPGELEEAKLVREKQLQASAEASQLIGLTTAVYKTLGDAGIDIANLESKMPQLVIVGDQSAGKSRVMESLAGMPFTLTDSDMATNMPTRVTFKQGPEKFEMQVEQKNADTGATESEWKEFGTVRELQEAIQGEMKEYKKKHSEYKIRQEDLAVRITSPTSANMEVVDLPGRRQAVGQSTANRQLKNEIDELQIRKMLNPNALILCVTKAGDLAQDRTLNFIDEQCRRVFPDRDPLQRVIVLQTFADEKIERARGKTTDETRAGDMWQSLNFAGPEKYIFSCPREPLLKKNGGFTSYDGRPGLFYDHLTVSNMRDQKAIEELVSGQTLPVARQKCALVDPKADPWNQKHFITDADQKTVEESAFKDQIGFFNAMMGIQRAGARQIKKSLGQLVDEFQKEIDTLAQEHAKYKDLKEVNSEAKTNMEVAKWASTMKDAVHELMTDGIEFKDGRTLLEEFQGLQKESMEDKEHRMKGMTPKNGMVKFACQKESGMGCEFSIVPHDKYANVEEYVNFLSGNSLEYESLKRVQIPVREGDAGDDTVRSGDRVHLKLKLIDNHDVNKGVHVSECKVFRGNADIGFRNIFGPQIVPVSGTTVVQNMNRTAARSLAKLVQRAIKARGETPDDLEKKKHELSTKEMMMLGHIGKAKKMIQHAWDFSSAIAQPGPKNRAYVSDFVETLLSYREYSSKIMEEEVIMENCKGHLDLDQQFTGKITQDEWEELLPELVPHLRNAIRLSEETRSLKSEIELVEAKSAASGAGDEATLVFNYNDYQPAVEGTEDMYLELDLYKPHWDTISGSKPVIANFDQKLSGPQRWRRMEQVIQMDLLFADELSEEKVQQKIDVLGSGSFEGLIQDAWGMSQEGDDATTESALIRVLKRLVQDNLLERGQAIKYILRHYARDLIGDAFKFMSGACGKGQSSAGKAFTEAHKALEQHPMIKDKIFNVWYGLVDEKVKAFSSNYIDAVEQKLQHPFRSMSSFQQVLPAYNPDTNLLAAMGLEDSAKQSVEDQVIGRRKALRKAKSDCADWIQTVQVNRDTTQAMGLLTVAYQGIRNEMTMHVEKASSQIFHLPLLAEMRENFGAGKEIVDMNAPHFKTLSDAMTKDHQKKWAKKQEIEKHMEAYESVLDQVKKGIPTGK